MTHQDHYFTAQPIGCGIQGLFILSMAISLLPILFSFNVKIFTVDIKIVLKLEYTQVYVCV